MIDATPLADLTLARFSDRLATSEPAPGGGSASALGGAIAAALVGMVAALSQGPRARREAVQAALDVEAGAAALRGELLQLVDLDAAAYTGVIDARRLPRETSEQRSRRDERVAQSMAEATLVPLRIAERAHEVLALAERLAPAANRNAVSDLGVAAQLGSAALNGAILNVRVNLPWLPPEAPPRIQAQAALPALQSSAAQLFDAILAAVDRQLDELGRRTT